MPSGYGKWFQGFVDTVVFGDPLTSKSLNLVLSIQHLKTHQVAHLAGNPFTPSDILWLSSSILAPQHKALTKRVQDSKENPVCKSAEFSNLSQTNHRGRRSPTSEPLHHAVSMSNSKEVAKEASGICSWPPPNHTASAAQTSENKIRENLNCRECPGMMRKRNLGSLSKKEASAN